MQGSKVPFTANFALTSVVTYSRIMFRSRSACETQPAVLQEVQKYLRFFANSFFNKLSSYCSCSTPGCSLSRNIKQLRYLRDVTFTITTNEQRTNVIVCIRDDGN